MLMQRQPFGSEANAAFLAAATTVDQSDAERLLQPLDTLTEAGWAKFSFSAARVKLPYLTRLSRCFSCLMSTSRLTLADNLEEVFQA